MAEIQVVKYRLVTSPASPTFISGHYIETMWDDTAGRFKVYHGSLFSTTVPRHEITSGPDIGAIDIDHVELTPINPIPYSFCNGLNLQSFEVQSLFPYAKKISTVNHFSCTSTVCDLQISDDVTIQPASDFTTSDGVIEVSASSSNGVIKFSLDPNFVYSSQGQESGIFAGLYPGSYTVTAKDELGCVDQITVEVTVPTDYNVRYRADYKDLNGIPSRVDILERGFTGSVTDVISGADPFVLRSEGQGELNKFAPVVPSTGVLTLFSESNFFFRDLFTQDDRKYQMRWYKDYGNTLPSFTPAELPSLTDWTNIDDDKTDWTTGATPSVSSNSNRLRSAYTFEAGREYKFSYTFTRSSSATDWMMIISLVTEDDGFVSLAMQKYVTFAPVAGLYLAFGSWTFVAPDSAAGIAVKVVKRNSGGGSLSITSFTNTTPTEAEQPAGYELKWMGHLISDNYSEPYIKHPYPVTITATDGLADLKNFDFLDKDGNKYRDDIISIKAISEILAKTDLDINIQSVLNRFETNMTQGATDDPLAQCKFNPETFYHDGKISNCLDVLSEILKPFGAVIKQRNGKWLIANPEELVAEANYREFGTNGFVQTSGTIEDVVNIKGAVMSERAVMQGGGQMLEVVPAYGKFFLEHTLLKHDSLVKSHGFEEADTYTGGNGVRLIRNWNVNISNAPGAVFGIKKTKVFEGDYNFYVTNLENVVTELPTTAGGIHVILSAAPFSIEYTNKDLFEFRFDYSVLIKSSDAWFPDPKWTRIQWTLKIGSYYYNQKSGWATDAASAKNHLYITSFNDSKEFKLTGAFREVVEATTEDVEITFYLEGANFSDFPSITALKAITTTDKAVGYRVRGREDVSISYRNYYILEDSTDAQSLPDVVRPNDYATSSNEKVWRYQGYHVIALPVDYIYLDNVVLLHFPNGEEPPQDVTVRRNNNPGIKINFEEQYLLNDIDIDNINNSERTYKNYFKLLDGTPTQEWERTYRAGKGKLLDLLSNDVVSQYKTPSNKITGSFLVDREVLPTSILNETGDGNRKYMFMGYSLHDKHASIDFDIVELKDTVTDDESDDIGAAFTIGFSLDFDS